MTEHQKPGDQSGQRLEGPARHPFGRRQFLGAAGATAGGALAAALARGPAAHAAPGSPATSTPHRQRPASGSSARAGTAFGIGYETWFNPQGSGAGNVGWGGAEATPVLGHYNSADPRVITQHAEWIHGAGIDFILIDWSNGTYDNIVNASLKLLDIYTTLPRHPKVAFLIGNPGGQPDATAIDILQSKVLAVPQYAALWQQFHGKPLLGVYGVSPTSPPPSYANQAFTIRYMDAFHEITMSPWGNWSWSDRTPIANGPMDFLPRFGANDFNGWTAGSNWSLADGGYLGYYATTEPGGGNKPGNLVSPAFTVTERAFTFIASGLESSPTATGDYRTVADIGARNLYVLTDAATGEVLRHAEPPGWTPIGFLAPSLQNATAPVWYLRQWNLRGLEGRQVQFQALNQNADGSTFGWLAVGAAAQTACEQMTAVMALGGNAAFGAWQDWDAHPRHSGATLVAAMQGVFDYEPEVALVQQWNEFGPPDQYGVEYSNDIEPTTITDLAGAHSDGWGYYYLDLVRSLISQYRRGDAIPTAALDTRYP